MISDMAGNMVAFSTLASGYYGMDNICLDIGACYTLTLSSGPNAAEVVWMMCG